MPKRFMDGKYKPIGSKQKKKKPKCTTCGSTKNIRYFVDYHTSKGEFKTKYYCNKCVDKRPGSDEALMNYWEKRGYDVGEYMPSHQKYWTGDD
jgi:hypothetical protein